MTLVFVAPIFLGLVGPSVGLWFVAGLWLLVFNVTGYALTTKRLHDLNISGWWLLGVWIMVVLLAVSDQINHH
jgi:uncharacterized membrane protein YhaH (DUF805 family)